MSSVSPAHRKATVELKGALRELSNQLSLLNRQVGSRLEMRDVDLDCLDVINRLGPLAPKALAREAGLHPATLTGILDRLQKGGWITRDPDPSDRRATLIRALRERNAELLGLFAGMNSSLDEICTDYDEPALALITDFLRRAGAAGRDATDDLN
ncbi:MarR family winged helix-turn-helix transcriptional regulator [Nocardia jejuensis]|uniref:MarR family winged helix-turn-helix transcriptional regulator n=1 Tax=Nocardia jejuensis TaxID=328049 RepID=UPI0008371F49|nr:MarR family transcriptional regulator [Nocardia jejuensis]